MARRKRRSSPRRKAPNTAALRARFNNQIAAVRTTARSGRKRLEAKWVKTLLMVLAGVAVGALAWRWQRNKGLLPDSVMGIPLGVIVGGGVVALAWAMGIKRSASILGAGTAVLVTEGTNMLLPGDGYTDTGALDAEADNDDDDDDGIIDIDFAVIEDIADRAAA